MKPEGGIACSILNLLLWGFWPFIRSQTDIKGPVFAPLYFLGNFTVALVLGLAVSGTSMFSDLNSVGDPWRVVSIMGAGFIVAFSDFLCACACSYVPYAIVFPIYSGITMVQGTLLTYFLTGGADPKFLFPGVSMGLIAIISLGVADMHKEKRRMSRAVTVDATMMEQYDEIDNNGKVRQVIGRNFGRRKDSIDAFNSPSSLRVIYLSAKTALRSVNKWVYICVYAGISGAFWSPFANYGCMGPQ